MTLLGLLLMLCCLVLKGEFGRIIIEVLMVLLVGRIVLGILVGQRKRKI